MRKFHQFLVIFSVVLLPQFTWALASNNIPLDSPIYSYLDKLAGFGLVTSEVSGLRPFSKAEAARLATEAEDNFQSFDGEGKEFAAKLLDRLKVLLPREISLRRTAAKPPLFDVNPAAAMRARYVYLDGAPRTYARQVFDPGNQGIFGIGHIRGQGPATLASGGTEGMPLVENNEGVVYRRGSNADLSIALEGFVSDKFSVFVEPDLLVTPEATQGFLRQGYVKLGGGGIELEAGRDANWFGPGFRGALTLTDNAKNFDLVKLSSPEPLDVAWIKDHLGNMKYALIVSRFDKSGTGANLRQPWFLGFKWALEPTPTGARPEESPGRRLKRKTPGAPR